MSYEANFVQVYEKVDIFFPLILSCWEVTCANHSYTRNQHDISNDPNNMYSLIRTISGQGKIITNKNIVTVNQESLFFAKGTDIIKYSAENEKWVYIWYNFITDQDIPFLKAEKVYNLSIEKEESETVRTIFNLVRSYSKNDNALANIYFCKQIYNWIQRLENNQHTPTPYYNEIKNAISYINENLSQKISITELAKNYGFSERNFRLLFFKATGKSPKQYHQYLKLRNAATQLKNTNLTIGAIAEKLGYYSQFQFCKDFKEHYGASPSEFRNGGYNINK